MAQVIMSSPLEDAARFEPSNTLPPEVVACLENARFVCSLLGKLPLLTVISYI
jgi:hypothetical protein